MQTTDRRLSFIGIRPTGDFAGLTAYTSRGGPVVWFIKSPPKKPASVLQVRQRRLFGAAAAAWQALLPAKRRAWSQAAHDAHLFLTGYTLWMWYTLTPDRSILATIERQSGIPLLA